MASKPNSPVLPEDYEDLNPEGQRQARVHAVSTWSSPGEYVQAWDLFRRLYFFPTEERFFYKHSIYESPKAHYEWVYDFEAYALNIMSAPRFSCKSQIMGREIPIHRSLVIPRVEILIVTASVDLVTQRFGELMTQLEENEEILRDFGVQKPTKGTKIWNKKHLTMANGSTILGKSVEARKRGLHPHEIILDDPEYDSEKAEGGETKLYQNMHQFLFRVLLPMIEDTKKKNMRIYWTGTMLDRRAALWHACNGDDPKFEIWNRRVYSMESRDPETGRATYFWPQRWGAAEIAQKKISLGPAAYQAECMNNPVSEEALVLQINELYDEYRVSENKVFWKSPGANQIPESFSMDYDQWLDGLVTIMTVDPAYSVTPRSDFSSILVTGVDSKRVWWLLGLFIARVEESVLMDAIYDLGTAWSVLRVGVEEAGLQKNMALRVEAEMAARNEEESVWVPRIFPIKYPMRSSKGKRMMGLQPRMSRHLIKLPGHLRSKHPWSILYEQIRNFTIDLNLLPFDDAIETLTMNLYMPMPRPGEQPEQTDEFDIMRQIATGAVIERKTGLPLSSFIDPTRIDTRQLNAAFYQRRAEK